MPAIIATVIPRPLRLGSRLDSDLVKLLDGIALTLGSARSLHPQNQPSAYREAIVSIHRHLRDRIVPADIRELTDTPTHDALMSLQLPSHEQVELGMDDLTHRLRSTAAAIRSELKRWKDAGHALVVDTSVLINHLTDGSIEKTEWRKLAGMEGHICTVVVPLAVLDEVDNHKRSNDKELRKRAQDLVRQLGRLIGDHPDELHLLNQAEPDVRFTVLVPPLDDEPLPKPDSDIIAQASLVHARIASGKHTKLLTADIGMAAQARSVGLDCVLIRQEAAPAEGR